MARRSSNGTTTQPKAGVLTEIMRNAQLAWHLLVDRRVGLLLKLIIPGLLLGYMIFPVDLLPDFIPVLGQLDDLAVIALGIKLFIELSPKDIVREYRGDANSTSSPIEPNGNEDAIDADYRVVK
jgi:uncharacterized membrane protein YkvA (DUF1232 family)